MVLIIFYDYFIMLSYMMYYEILIYLKYLFATFGFPTLETEKYQIFLKTPKNLLGG